MGLTDDLTRRVTEALLGLMAKTPASEFLPSPRPAEAAKKIMSAAAKKSAAVSGTLAIPPGPAGLLTVLPDLIVVWRIQQQMVADIAAVFDQSAALNTEAMTYCMFQHSSSAIVRDLLARTGGRSVLRRATGSMIRSILRRIGVRMTKLLLGKSVARLLPLVGAAAVAGYAYHDTIKVAGTAIKLFGHQLAPPPAPLATA